MFNAVEYTIKDNECTGMFLEAEDREDMENQINIFENDKVYFIATDMNTKIEYRLNEKNELAEI